MKTILLQLKTSSLKGIVYAKQFNQGYCGLPATTK